MVAAGVLLSSDSIFILITVKLRCVRNCLFSQLNRLSYAICVCKLILSGCRDLSKSLTLPILIITQLILIFSNLLQGRFRNVLLISERPCDCKKELLKIEKKLYEIKK